MKTTFNVPVSWLLLPITMPYWTIRIALGCILYFFYAMDGKTDSSCEILEVEQIETGPRGYEGVTGNKIKAVFTPSIPCRVFGEKPTTLIVHRIFALEADRRFPEYRDSDGHRIYWRLEGLITSAMNARAATAKRNKKLQAFHQWKKDAADVVEWQKEEADAAQHWDPILTDIDKRTAEADKLIDHAEKLLARGEASKNDDRA